MCPEFPCSHSQSSASNSDCELIPSRWRCGFRFLPCGRWNNHWALRCEQPSLIQWHNTHTHTHTCVRTSFSSPWRGSPSLAALPSWRHRAADLQPSRRITERVEGDGGGGNEGRGGGEGGAEQQPMSERLVTYTMCVLPGVAARGEEANA